MNCSEVLEKAPLSLNEDVSEDVRRHLDSCPSCARQFSEARAFDQRLKASVLAEEEQFNIGAFEQKVMRQIAEESVVRNVPNTIPTPPRFAWPWAALGMIAAGAAAMLSFVVYQGVKPKPSTFSMAAAHDHR